MPAAYLYSFHQLPSGRIISAGQLAASVKIAKANPDTFFRDAIGQAFGGTGSDHVRAFRHWSNQEINRRGGLIPREPRSYRIARERGKRVKCDCRWCGTRLEGYREPNVRFCDHDCKLSFYS